MSTVACTECGALMSPDQLSCDDCSSPEKRRSSGPAALPEAIRTAFASCCLTAKDFTLLELYLNERTADDPFTAHLVKSKLAATRVVLPRDVDPNVATLNSRVTFRLNGRSPEARLLVHWDQDIVVGLTLPVTTPLGITLLGMRAGEEASVLLRGGITWPLRLEAVTYQPERERDAGVKNIAGRETPR